MKRPFLDTIFGPISIDVADAASRLLHAFVEEFDDTYLSAYYARMRYDDQGDTFEWTDEAMDLAGRDDLLRRIVRDHGGRWSCDVNLMFGPAVVYPAFFFDPVDGSELTTVVSTGPGVTQYVESDDGVRLPFVLFLTRIAEVLGVGWFVTGLEIEHWRRLPATGVMSQDRLPPGTYVVGWRHGAIDEATLLAGLGASSEDVRRTTTGYRFVTFFPDA
jgi:hypothetical protein